MRFEPVIGLECHVQLATRTKVFSGASASFGAPPNTHDDAYTLALPGTLPVLNRAAVDCALMLGLAVGGKIRARSRFARKHYFYPDLPKGYQISQYDEPLIDGGIITFVLDGQVRTARLHRIHMEEDAGKNIHLPGAPHSLVDYNRAGVPLCEIVSEPELHSAAEAAAYLRAIRQLVRWLGISDGNMEEGSLRCDANVSVRPAGETKLGTKAEVKNMNSFKNVEAAIEFEIARQSALCARGERVKQETRLWNADQGTSHAMRSKEGAHDYRYFPEPDLPPLVVAPARIEALRAALPELPLPRRQRFIDALGLSPYDASVLTAERAVADYFEEAAAGGDAKQASNWVSTELLGRLHREDKTIEQSPIGAAQLGELLGLVRNQTISGKIAKDVFDKMWSGGGSPAAIVAAEGLTQVTDDGVLTAACRAAVDANPKQAEGYRAGKLQMLGFFVGQVMKATQGKANPERVNQLLKGMLEAK